MASLQFFLLGTPRLEQHRHSVNLSRRKAIAVLAYLAVTRQPYSRDALATLLWPDQDQSGARANLRRDLSTLKQTLGDQTLLIDQDHVSLNPDADLWIDAEAFQAKIETAKRHAHAAGSLCAECAASLVEAVELYGGDFMAGFSLPDSPEFDEWQFFETERMRQLLAGALQRLIAWHTNRTEYDQAIEYARRWLALDALHEPAHRQLMQLYAWSGQHSAALRQYQECVRLLEDELGAPPDAETTALYQAIRTKQLAPPVEEDQSPEPAPGAITELAPHERYVPDQLLSLGGYGEVYLGRDRVADRAVVIKRLKPELVAKDPSFVVRFALEAEALRQLNHPNIVAILATIEHGGEHSIVMEYVPGGTLRDLLDQAEPLPYPRIVNIALELADALSRAHHLNIIHRDLKPDNVLLAADGTPRLTDFGMARLQQDNRHLTQPGMIIGSPGYLSPEALRGEEPDARSDIWSFGVLLYEMISGRCPFEGQQVISVLNNILHTPVPDIERLRSDVPPPLADLVRRMLMKDRNERIASMRLVAAELEAIRAGRPLKPAPDRSPEQITVTSTTISPVDMEAARSETAPRRALEQDIRFCRSAEGVRLAYATIGDGPPLVKAANWLSHLEYDWQSPIWRHWLIGLAQQHTLIRYDERGCGLSDWSVDEISFEAWVRDLEAVIEATGVERFPLMGISKGGSVAITYTARHPEKVSHLILYGAYARGRLIRNTGPQQAEEVELMTNLIRIGWGREDPVFRQVFASSFMPDGTREQHRWFNDLQRASASPENAVRIYAGSNLIDVRDLAAQLQVPTLVLHARGDMRVPLEEGRFLASLIPGARLVTLESNNHILLEDEPAWPRFLQELHRFLATTPHRPIRQRAPARPIDASPLIASVGRSTPRHNLPAPATPFIDREKELADIRALVVDDPACRLLTLIGPGGIGKTRLALVAAAESLDAFQDGATLVALATVGAADFILSALVDALDFNLAGATTPQDQLLNYLCDKQLLLIFDNFEHVLPGAELLADILLAAPQVKIVATSRERLNLLGEWIYEVPGMTFPRAAEPQSAAELADLQMYSAVQLFIQRARQVVANFAPTADDARAIARICQLVEGSPLAIELAAAWVKVLDCAAIAGEVERGLEVLTTHQRGIPEHHRSMRAVFDQTWERLTDDERRVFQQLSVFRDGFRRAAAEQVAEASLAILSALVDKSLLRWDLVERYQVHELLRQYAAEQLARAPDQETRSYDRHSRYYAVLLEDNFKQILDGQQLEVTRQIEMEIGNIRAAWSWAVTHNRIEFIRHAAPALWSFYEFRSRYLEGANMLEQALKCLSDQPATEAIDRSRVHTQVSLAWLYIRLGRLQAAEDCSREALAIYERLGIPPVRGVATDPRVALGILASIRGDYAEMVRWGKQAVQLSEQHDHRWNRSYAYYLMTRATLAHGDYEQAQTYAQQASTAAQRSNDHWFLAYCLNELGNVALAQDEFAAAKEHYRASYVIRQEFADREGMALALNRLATATLRQQDYAEAKALYLQSLELYRELNDKGGLASTLNGLAFVASGQADYGTATQHFRRALQIAEELHFAPLAMWILLGIGEMLLKTRRIRRGVELLALVIHHPASEREARLRSQRRLERVHDRLPPEEYAASYQRGQQADLDQTLAQLLTDLLGWQASSHIVTSQRA